MERIPGTEVNVPIPGALVGEPQALGTKAVAPAFIIGVWYQPTSSFALWKARGVNTMIGYENEGGNVSNDDWTRAAVGSGLFMIRQPRTNLGDDMQEDHLLAWMQPDEPETKNIGPDALKADYQRWKARAPRMPVLLNISGGNLLFKKTPRSDYAEYFESADWIGNDFYPVTGWNQPTWLSRVGNAVDMCREISGGKPQFAFVETSNQKLTWLPPDARGATPGEMRAEIWDAVIHGVKGIVYFPQQMTPFQFDATPPKVSVEMVRQNRLLTAAGAALALPPNPKELKATVNAPMEAAWRRADDGTVYVIALNLSGDPQFAQPVRLLGSFAVGKAQVLKEGDRTVNVTANGFVDDFEPFGVHVYALGGAKQPQK